MVLPSIVFGRNFKYFICECFPKSFIKVMACDSSFIFGTTFFLDTTHWNVNIWLFHGWKLFVKSRAVIEMWLRMSTESAITCEHILWGLDKGCFVNFCKTIFLKVETFLPLSLVVQQPRYYSFLSEKSVCF